MFSMLKTVLKNLTQKPATRNYPEECRTPFAGTRGHLEIDPTDCKACNKCAMVCPANALEVDKKARTVKLNLFRCVNCGECIDACDVGSMKFSEDPQCPNFLKVVETHQAPEKKRRKKDHGDDSSDSDESQEA
jgi:formate hydrogenlyase subunit 6/NADH:ubiquinone oxidoreductase subunit I